MDIDCYIKIRKDCSIKGISYKTGQIVSARELKLSKEDFKKIVEELAAMPCESSGFCVGKEMRVR
jgi:hypothetical protein